MVLTNSKLIKTLGLLFCLSASALYTLERTKATIIDPVHEIPLAGYAVELGNGNIYYTADISKLVQKMLACPAAAALVNNVLKDGPVIIRYGEPLEAPAGGKWLPEVRLIVIDPEESDARQLGHTLFELANALQYSQQGRLIQDVEDKKIGRDDYAQRWEEIEYYAAKDFTAAVESCIKTHKWPEATGIDIPLLFKGGAEALGATFEKFWSYIKNTQHSELFRTDWDRGHKAPYCKANPRASECRK